MLETVGTTWMWAGFFVFVAFIIAVDIWKMGSKTRKVTIRESLSFVIFTIVAAFIFNILLWFYLHHQYGLDVANQKALEFFTGYLLEESLSIDNMFVFVMIFTYFSIPVEYQPRVLVMGIISAVILRLILILLGALLISRFHWILYLFGVFLIFTGIKLFFSQEKQDLSNNIFVLFIRKHLRVTDKLYQNSFFVNLNGVWYATPLFLVLILIEISDIVFAIDSIPAIFAITRDTYIIFTSNVFAILGLRALYFALADMHEKFSLLRYGISIILVFIGTKMLIAPWIKIPILITLTVVVTTIATSIFLSIRRDSEKS